MPAFRPRRHPPPSQRDAESGAGGHAEAGPRRCGHWPRRCRGGRRQWVKGLCLWVAEWGRRGHVGAGDGAGPGEDGLRR